jgi:hypothetical protein
MWRILRRALFRLKAQSARNMIFTSGHTSPICLTMR